MKKDIYNNSVKYMLFFSFLLIRFFVNGQSNYEENVLNIGEGLRLELGTFIPFQELSNAVQLSPVLTLGAGVSLSEGLRLDPELSFVFIQSENKIGLITDEGRLDGRVSSVINFGANINKVYKLNRISVIDVRLGTGISYLSTDRKIHDAKKKEDDEYFDATTMYFKMGVGYKIAAFEYSYIGLEFNYQFTPYNLFHQHLYSSFGTQNFNIGLSYGI